MRLYELDYACRIYAGLTGFDNGYLAFLRETDGELDFKNPVHVKSLLVWLNSWGCRQFAIAYHDQAAASLRTWAQRWEPSLPDPSTTLSTLSNEDLEAVGEAYADLSGCFASERTRNSGRYKVQVGPAGAAKILFAARPQAVPPWDEPIRARLGFDGGARSFCEYLRRVREEISQLRIEAARLGVRPEDIPQEVGRPRSTIPKLIDEYNWVTITNDMRPPTPDEVVKWHVWCGSH